MNWLDEIALEYHLLGLNNPSKCEYCKRAVDLVIETPSMTRYYFEKGQEDPNRDKILCLPCAQDHVSYWEDQWADYYSGIL